MANGNGKWNTPNGNGNATSIACMHAYRKCKRLLSQARLRLQLRLSQQNGAATGAGPANDDTMADGSDKLKLFFARFYQPSPHCTANRNAPTSFSLATLGIVFFFCKKRFDLITANVRVLLFVCRHSHTRTYNHTNTHRLVCCVSVHFSNIFMHCRTLRSALLPVKVFSIFAFSHFAFCILGAAENSASFFEFLRNLPQSIQILLLLLLLL